MSDLVDALRGVVGADHVLVDADVRASYETDWSRQWHGEAICVVRPANVAEVSAVVQACAAAGATIVTQGGNTGLVGGSVPRSAGDDGDGASGDRNARQVVLSTRRLTDLGEVDLRAQQVTVGAGVTIERLQQHARAAGLEFAVDWGARASATVGGAVATNAGGSRVVRFGTMRAQVMGLQAVLADGSVISQLDGLPKETTGPSITGLMIGSEGTLGIVTAATLKLVPRLPHTAAALFACDSLMHAVGLLPTLRTLRDLDAVELLLPEALHIACRHLGVKPPIDPASAGAFVLVDCAGRRDPSDELADVAAKYSGVFAEGPQREQLFAIRDHVTVALAARGVPLKLDVAVPVVHLDRLVRTVRTVLREHAPRAELVVFGHLAEGNLHINVLDAGDATELVTEAVLAAAIELGGTISAEHGIGVAKVEWLERAKGTAHVAALRAVKRALDPHGLLNPGVLLPG